MGNVEQHLRKSPSLEEPYAKKTIGSKGGILRVKGHGVTLNIPPGALPGNKDLKLQLLGEELPEEFTSKDEVSLCPGVRCFPSGLTFQNPVQLTLTHCAELTEQILSGEGEVLLYTREESQRGSRDQNITRTQLVPPVCEFFRDRINIYLKQFADCWIRIKSDFIHGKKVGCLPFVPIEMPRTRKPIVRCSVYDLTEGHSERIRKEEAVFGFRQPMTQECELLVRPMGTDLHIVIKDRKRREFKKTINYDNVLQLERNAIFVELDYSQKPENELNMAVELSQGDKNMTDVNRASLQFRTVLQATQRRVVDSDDDEIESKSQKKKRLESVDDDLLFKVADKIDNDEVLDSLMQALDIGMVSRRRCLETNRSEGKVSERGTRDVLLKWRSKTDTAKQRSGLESALTKAELHDLRTKLFQEEKEDRYRSI